MFVKEKLPLLQAYKVPIIVSIAAETPQEYGEIAKRLDSVKSIAAIEINISCPNIHTNRLFAQDASTTATVVKAVRKTTSKTVITKLSPNVTDIVPIASAAEKAGSDGLALINTISGMAVDVERRRPVLGNIKGGLSGPAIKPVALWMVWRVYHNVSIPIVGMGGIMDWKDAIEFMLCGSTAVSIGTGNFVDPNTGPDVLKGISGYLKDQKIQKLTDILGTLKA